MKKRSRTGTRYCGTDDIEVIESSGSIVVERPIYVLGSGIIIIITMRRLTHHVSVIRMTNRRRDIRGVQNEKGRCPGGGQIFRRSVCASRRPGQTRRQSKYVSVKNNSLRFIWYSASLVAISTCQLSAYLSSVLGGVGVAIKRSPFDSRLVFGCITTKS